MKSASDKKTNDFNQISKDTETVDMQVLMDIIEMMHKKNPDLVFKHKTEFDALINILFFIPIVFNSAKDFKKRSFELIAKLIVRVFNNPDSLEKENIKSILNVKMINEVFEKLDMDVTIQNSKKMPDEQKVMVEFIILLKKLDSIIPYRSIYKYPKIIFELEKAAKIFGNRRDFDFISYLLYLKGLDKSKLNELETKVKVASNLPDLNYVAKYKVDDVDALTINFDKKGGLLLTETLAITLDQEGEEILQVLTSNDLAEGKSIHLFSNEFYIHYPYHKGKLVSFGDNQNERLGVSGDKISLTIQNQVDLDFKMIRSRNDFTIGLTTNNELYFCGTKESLGTSQKFVKYLKELPTNKGS